MRTTKMDHIIILNRIGRTLMTITSQNSTQSFEIASGPITTSIRTEPYEYATHPFSYSREALRGRLEIWDSTGRLVYSWQRNYSPTRFQHQVTPILLATQSQNTQTIPDERFETGSPPTRKNTQVLATEDIPSNVTDKEIEANKPRLSGSSRLLKATVSTTAEVEAVSQNPQPIVRKRKRSKATETRLPQRTKPAFQGLWLRAEDSRVM